MNESILTWTDTTGFNFVLLLMLASGLILGVGFGISWLLRRFSAANRFTAWQATFIALAVIPFGPLLLPELPLGWSMTPTNGQENAVVEGNHFVQTANLTKGTGLQPNTANLLISPGSRAEMPIANHSVDGLADRNLPVKLVSEAPNQSAAAIGDAAAAKKLTFLPTWRSTLVFMWLLGVVLGIARLVRTYFQALGIVSRSAPSTDNERRSKTGPAVLVSDEVEIPVTTGIFKPKILLPKSSSQWSKLRSRFVLLHEQAHIDRSDVAWQSFTLVVSSMFWFQPLVWLAESQMKIERERACDDQVLRQGEKAIDYAQVLLEFAAELGGKSPKLFGALSMTQKPIEKRMATILDAETNRAASTRMTSTSLVCVLVSLATIVSVLRPWSPIPASAAEPKPVTSFDVSDKSTPSTTLANESSLTKQDDETDVDKSALPDFLTGKVLDQHKKPIANAKVELQLVASVGRSHGFHESETTTLKVVQTDEHGEYKLETRGLKVSDPKRTLIRGYITKLKFLDANVYFSLRKGNPELRDTILYEGRKISGRIVAPGGETNAVANPTVQVIADDFSKGNYGMFQWSSRMIKCEPNGEFEVWVPKLGRVEIEATSLNYAGVRTYVAPTDSELGEIKLVTGTSYYGVVRKRDGTPVAGAIVCLAGARRTDLSKPQTHVFSPTRFAVKTDQKGKYQLPPYSGDFRIHVSHQGKAIGSDELLTSKIKPVILPKLIKATTDEKVELDLIEATTSKISGTILWKDGTPAANVQVRAYVMTGGSSIDVGEVFTDSAGAYQVDFPIETPEGQAGLMVIGAIDEDRVSNVAYVKPKEEYLNHRCQGVTFKSVATNISDVDWELRVRDEPKIKSTYTVHKRTKADAILIEIGTRFYRNRGSVNLADLTKELVKLESDYRGEFAAVMAIRQALQWSDGWPEPAESRAELLEVLQKHYVQHKDADLCLESLLVQSYDLRGLEVLATFQNNSPHEHVRAKACYLQAEHLSQQLAHQSWLKSRDWNSGYDLPSEYSAEQRKQLADAQDRMIDAYRSLDVTEVREKIDELTKTIREDYADIVRSGIISPIESFDFERHQSKDAKTYARLIEPIYFELEKLQTGMTIPEVEGLDVLGKPFKLSKLRGKVVLLFFTRSWYGERQKKFYAKFAELKEKHQSVPFEVVTILTDRDEKWAKDPVEKGWITWPTYWDKDESLAKKWHIRWSTSELILIDDQGVIRGRHGIDDKRLPKALDDTIKKASSRN